MPREEFMLLNTFLHFADNQNANLSDRLYKVRPMLNHLISNWQKYYTLNREICIDERMIKFRGRIRFIQYIPSKPTKWGIKAFVLADAHNVIVLISKSILVQKGIETQILLIT